MKYVIHNLVYGLAVSQERSLLDSFISGHTESLIKLLPPPISYPRRPDDQTTTEPRIPTYTTDASCNLRIRI